MKMKRTYAGKDFVIWQCGSEWFRWWPKNRVLDHSHDGYVWNRVDENDQTFQDCIRADE